MKVQKAHCSHCDISFYSENGKDWKRLELKVKPILDTLESELDNDIGINLDSGEGEKEEEEPEEDIIHFPERDKKCYCPYCDTEIIVNRNLKSMSQYTKMNWFIIVLWIPKLPSH